MDKYYKSIIIYENKDIIYDKFLGFTFDKNSLFEIFFGNRLNTKHKNLKRLLDNREINNDTHDSLMDIFTYVQKTYWNISKFARIWRYKNARIYNKEDLYLNPINESMRNVVVIFQNNWKYLFPLKELMKFTNENLMNSPYFFPNPLSCKNPYTNIPLSKSQLYYIYFKIRESDYTIPILYYRFFLCNFNIKTFSNENQALIKETYMKHAVNNINRSDVINIVNEMLKYHRIKRIRINPFFPKDILFDKLKNYISLYLESINNYNMNLRLDLCKKLHVKLSNLVEYNPNFGRKRVKLVSNEKNPFKRKQIVVTYNDDVPLFDEPNSQSFMNSHNELYDNNIPVELPRLTRHYAENNIRVSRTNNRNTNLIRMNIRSIQGNINTIIENYESDENRTVVLDDSDEENSETHEEMEQDIELEIEEDEDNSEEPIEQELEEMNNMMNELYFENESD
jgi:hypothetical protein